MALQPYLDMNTALGESQQLILNEECTNVSEEG